MREQHLDALALVARTKQSKTFATKSARSGHWLIVLDHPVGVTAARTASLQPNSVVWVAPELYLTLQEHMDLLERHTRYVFITPNPVYIRTGRPEGGDNATHPLYRFCAAHPHSGRA